VYQVPDTWMHQHKSEESFQTNIYFTPSKRQLKCCIGRPSEDDDRYDTIHTDCDHQMEMKQWHYQNGQPNIRVHYTNCKSYNASRVVA
jgi:hypothetical protein